MKNILKVLLITLFSISSLFALQKDEIKTVMTKKIDDSISIIKKQNLTTKEKGQEIVKIIDEVFDFRKMALLSLGRDAWVSATTEQKKRYLKAFEINLKNSYIDKLGLYTDQKVKVIDLESTFTQRSNTERIQLVTELIGQSESYKVNYLFYENKTRGWVIWDINLAGTSVITTTRKQYAGLLKQKSLEEMISEIEAKNKING
ncbi:Tgt2/MlaC family protein [Poseidonibacter ostreae]|jgi:phospholipid transport system substrate-binding protein|uniref:ABC transporter substrate-binding protein n=1 Tax=Poseidonibacter ostreae TaxID=2654171 RepID=A0A6L4WQ79_9BACT|nr:ABC transporter substrate-binding protein [Poseidonibacter ostreae]KAB7882035.1 ABC transporter substrate-binding protein [Poseidonibacter ostreae]KAB7886632.1 ABC transporter substrate-binding protein [Poseidonibacter ostreae]KAB7889242.1 ABC transporter substrate-binding protein [Poseidonibacter ostreae]MAC82641.1 toluene tolerance protein [Arcobacter sp.]|tara:strand:+ start:5127 stop:5735 length:609 start_codon:yes stop_codon:yes gene_type:complete